MQSLRVLDGERLRDHARGRLAEEVELGHAELVHGVGNFGEDSVEGVVVVVFWLGRAREAMAARVAADDAVVSRKYWDPVVPEVCMATKAMLDEDGFAWFPRVGEVVVDDVGYLPVGVGEEFA